MKYVDCLAVIGMHESSDELSRFISSFESSVELDPWHDVVFYSLPSCGISISVSIETKLVDAISLYCGEQAGYERFNYRFAAGVSFNDNLETVQLKMGMPTLSNTRIKPPPYDVFESAMKLADETGLQVASYLEKLHSLVYKLPDNKSWSFEFNEDHTLCAASVYYLPKN